MDRSTLCLTSKAELIAFAVTDVSEIHVDIEELEDINRMVGLLLLVMKWLPVNAMKKDPEFIKLEVVDTPEIDGPQNAEIEQTNNVELLLILATVNTICCSWCDLWCSFARVLLNDIHLVASFDEATLRPFALPSNIPKHEPEIQIAEEPDTAKAPSLNDFINGTSNEMLLVVLRVNSE